MMPGLCGQKGPPWWLPVRECVLPHGHPILFRRNQSRKDKRREVVPGTGHCTQDEREWPIKAINLEFL